MVETLVGIVIVLLILGISFFIAYWGFTSLLKDSKKSRRNENAELRKEVETLKKRVELLEKERNAK